ncbi:methyltransferase [Sneathiella litorea]|uniref:Methyltransferase domain-containing protein n=1 Tax=Sneathiella litorea TaxID=2606216 RepID=A0A6L8WBS2_9PROT|nr:methyltransferase [Sneathiella litorea]MZR31922.1 methyltransferase domain-containing protein [Sneathiella litorea]
MSVKPVETAEEVSTIAFGFMASKAMFAGLHLDVFTQLASGPKTCQELSKAVDVPINRIVTLMTALNGVGLVEQDDNLYSNSAGAEAFLSRTSKYEFGDYLRYQIDQQMYPFLGQLNEVLDGSLNSDAVDSYQHWMSDPEQAALYSNAQHAGSLGPGLTIARTVDLSGAKSLLDVGGGTGAMTIRLLEANPELNSTIIDFPNVSEIGWRFITEAEMTNRVRYIPSNALTVEWPTEQDAILMSYLFSGIPGSEVPRLVKYAFDCLAPGGKILVHDFMVEDDRTGPVMAALWQLQHMAFTPEARSVTAGWLKAEMEKVGFVDIQDEQTIPGMTHLVHARKPD